MNKLKAKKGFTLMEMLIVVAIIAILIAIAVPVFSSQMNTAKQQVDAANLRTATSLAVVKYMLDDESGEITYHFTIGEGNSMIAEEGLASKKQVTDTAVVLKRTDETYTIRVIVEDGEVTTADWFAPTT